MKTVTSWWPFSWAPSLTFTISIVADSIPSTSASLNPVKMTLPMREDKVTDGAKRDQVLANAPKTEDGFFVVPKVVE